VASIVYCQLLQVSGDVDSLLLTLAGLQSDHDAELVNDVLASAERLAQEAHTNPDFTSWQMGKGFKALLKVITLRAHH
jgi:hypothetical protein